MNPKEVNLTLEEKNCLDVITAIQSGRLDPLDSIRYNPFISGRGVPPMRLQPYYPDPVPLAKLLRSLVEKGKIENIDDGPGFPLSFSVLSLHKFTKIKET